MKKTRWNKLKSVICPNIQNTFIHIPQIRKREVQKKNLGSNTTKKTRPRFRGIGLLKEN